MYATANIQVLRVTLDRLVSKVMMAKKDKRVAAGQRVSRARKGDPEDGANPVQLMAGG